MLLRSDVRTRTRSLPLPSTPKSAFTRSYLIRNFFYTSVIIAVFIKSERNKYMVIFNQFKYKFASQNARREEIRWRRVRRTRSATT